jgi:peptidyl-prolyl cis-trans isomerase B (cyclophilin B)
MRKVKFITTLGDIVMELDDEKAPISTQNMIDYIEAEHYKGLLFHRVIDGFMIQGGGYDKELKKRKVKEPIKNEAKNGLKNVTGSVAMARTPDIDSATSQFFINVVDNPFLDHKDETPEGYGYAVFGKVVEGMETVEKIKAVETGAKGPFAKDCPAEDIEITNAEVVKEEE